MMIIFRRLNSLIKDLVTIIIPTFNRADTIEATVNSCLDQSYLNLEIIVIDDGSTDDTHYLLEKNILNNKIIYIYQQNSGRSKARNLGLKMAKGEFIQFLDSDDLLEKNKIEKQINKIKADITIDGIYGQTIYFKNNIDNVIKKVFINVEKDFEMRLLQKNFITISSILIRKCDINFDEELNAMEDWDFWIKYVQQGKKIVAYEEGITYVRIHEGNTSNNIDIVSQYTIKVLNKYLNHENNSHKDIILFNLYKSYKNIKNNKQAKEYLYLCFKVNKKYILIYSIYRIKYYLKKIIKRKGIFSS